MSALLSKSEGLPMAALEAMATGTAVVLSEGCHLPEVDGEAGLVVPGGAAGAADALATLLLDEPRRASYAAGARAFAEDFRREAVMPRMLAFLESIAGRGPSACRATATALGGEVRGRSAPAIP